MDTKVGTTKAGHSRQQEHPNRRRRMRAVAVTLCSLAITLAGAGTAHAGSSAGAGGAATSATPPPLTMSVTLTSQKARMFDGIVTVVAWTQCSPGLTAFEFDISINQGSAFGSTIQLFPDVVPCDGTSHRSEVLVSADIGAFRPGPATISAYLSGNNGGGDIEATDEVTAPLRKVWQPAIVEISQQPIQLTANRSVRVVFWFRCAAKYLPYELDVTANQGDAYSVYTKNGPPVVTCDGTRHKMVTLLPPSDPRFRAGQASIGIFLGLYDTVEDHDADIFADQTVRLLAPAS